MHRVYPRGALAAQVLGLVGTEGKGLAGLEYARDSLLRGHSGERRVVSDAIGQPVSITETHPVAQGKSLTLTLDANIQQRTEDVLGAVAKDFSPKDATAIVMDPRTGAILALANWPQANPNDPAASPAGSTRGSRGGFRLRTGIDVQGGDRLRRAPAGADHPRNPLQHPRPDPRGRPYDPRRHRTPRRNAHHLADPRSLEQRRRDQDRRAGGRERLQRLGAPLWLRRAQRAWTSPARKWA